MPFLLKQCFSNDSWKKKVIVYKIMQEVIANFGRIRNGDWKIWIF